MPSKADIYKDRTPPTDGTNQGDLWVNPATGELQVNDGQRFRAPFFPASAPSQNKAANYNVAAAESGLITYCTKTLVATLPATVVGQTYTFVNAGPDGAVQISLSPNASDKIIGITLAGADNKDCINTLLTARRGDMITLAVDGVDGWFVVAARGTWEQEG